MNHYELSNTLKKDIINTFNSIREVIKENSKYVKITYDRDLKIKIEHLDSDSGYFFIVENPKQDKNRRITYNVIQKPTNSNKTDKLARVLDSGNDSPIIKNLKMWINLVKFSENFNPHQEDKILQSYKERFFNAIKFEDDIDDDQPLGFKEQEQLKQFITLSIKALEVDDEDHSEIINGLQELNKLMPQMTKGQFKSEFSWYLANMKYKGIDIINWISTKGKEAGFSYIFIEGFKALIGG